MSGTRGPLQCTDALEACWELQYCTSGGQTPDACYATWLWLRLAVRLLQAGFLRSDSGCVPRGHACVWRLYDSMPASCGQTPDACYAMAMPASWGLTLDACHVVTPASSRNYSMPASCGETLDACYVMAYPPHNHTLHSHMHNQLVATGAHACPPDHAMQWPCLRPGRQR